MNWRLEAESKLTCVKSDKPLLRPASQLAELKAYAMTVFGKPEYVDGWFELRQPGLGGLTPRQAISTEGGAREVRAILGRIEHGVFN